MKRNSILLTGIISTFFSASLVLAAAPSECSLFTSGSVLTPSVVHPDVIKLQIVLNKDPETQVSVSGAGSPGNETTKYGVATVAAVKRFQEKYWKDILEPAGLVDSTGLFGSFTRKKMQALYCSATTLAANKHTGLITFATPSCTIPKNAKSCDIQLSWSSSNTTAPSVTQLGSKFSSLPTSPYITRTISFGATTFTLEDSGTPLSNKTAKAVCETGSVWDGSVCKASAGSSAKAAGVLFFATPSCTIPKNAKSCNIQLSWSSSNTTAPSVTQLGSKFSSLPTSPYITRTISFGATTFTLEDSGTPLSNKTAKAVCETGSVWDGNVCAVSP